MRNAVVFLTRLEDFPNDTDKRHLFEGHEGDKFGSNSRKYGIPSLAYCGKEFSSKDAGSEFSRKEALAYLKSLPEGHNVCKKCIRVLEEKEAGGE